MLSVIFTPTKSDDFYSNIKKLAHIAQEQLLSYCMLIAADKMIRVSRGLAGLGHMEALSGCHGASDADQINSFGGF